MAQKNINIGTGELKGDGETLRSAFSKIEDNFTELYLGGGGSGIALTDLSVGAEGTPSGDGAIAYDNTTGVFTYTPPAGGGGGITEIVQDTTPQLGGALDTNGNNITFGTDKAQFGAANDLGIWHNGAHSIIRETGTGDLYLQSDNNVILSTDSSTKKMLKGVGSGEVILYHNDVQKLNTSSSGVTVVDELHTEGATPHLTLKRTDNANVPTLRFKGSGGVIGASIDFQGTSGTSNELAFQTYNGVSLAERFRVGHTATTVAGNLIVSGDFTVNGTTTTVNTTEMTVSDNIITLNSDVTGAPSQNAGIEVERGSSDNVSIRWNETSDQWEFTNDGASYTAIGSGGGGISNVVEDTTPELGGDLNVGGNSIVGGNGPINLAPGGTAAINLSADETITTGKILYSNMYAQLADLPNATTYHGMFAHVHATGAGYFAHGGNWIQLANYTDLSPYLPTANLGTNVDLHLNQASAGNNQVLSWDGADYAWVNQSGGGGGLADVVDDTTPQLGGNLDANGNNISLPDSSRIIIGTGNDSELRWDAGDSEARYSATGDIQLAPSGRLQFNTGGTDRWQFTSAGHLLPEANASYDIGSADYKVRHLFLSDNSLKFVDASDTEHALGVDSINSSLQFKGKDVIISQSTYNQLIDVSGAGLGISIGTASTSGSTISIGAEVNDTSVNMYGVTEFGARAIFNRGVHEKFLTITGATGTVDHNVQNGHVFYHTGAAANWTANFTNLSLAQEDATNIAIVIDQGNTSYIPNAVQIGGVAQTVVWNGNSVPTGTDNGKDIVSFTILNDGGTYVIFGQLVSFGGV